jgi:uncharacterized membrane protein|tara:strand:- start:1865 stop:2659 length:795 start_codon:yes stop_codon:yes gene_type:complete
MKRYGELDIVKGIAVICMVVFHLFYFPNKYGFKEIEYDTTLLNTIAKIAQFIFIGSVGINLTLSKEKSNNADADGNEYIKRSLKRTLKLVFLAALMSLFTYFVFGDSFVKFGILHFIAFASFALFYIVDDLKIIYTLLILSILAYYMILKNPMIFAGVPEKLAFVSGFYNLKYDSIDHFPIFPWIIVVLLGVLLGHYIKKNKPQLPENIKENIVVSSLEKIGKTSLEIYSIHWIVLYVIYCIVYPKWIRGEVSIPVNSTVSPDP